MKSHMKRTAAPASWHILRKTTAFITNVAAGPHSKKRSMPISVWLRELGFAATRREAKKILLNKVILIDGRRVKDPKFPLGLFDVLSIPDVKKHYTIDHDTKGRLKINEIKDADAKQKTCQIVGKTVLKGNKIQLNMFDGKNIIVDKSEHKVGDSVVIELPSQKIKTHLPLKKGAAIELIGGSHIGTKGTVEKVEGQRLWYNTDKKNTIETYKKYAYPIQ